MSKDLIDNLIIIPKPNYISWEDITTLLHLGYAERAEEGLQYSATDQSVQKTIERVDNGICLVALLNGELVATESYKLVEKKNLKRKRWFYDNNYYYLHSLSVHPNFKKKGIGLKIRNVIRDEAIKNNISSLISDTSEHAGWLIDWYSRLGHKKVGYVSHFGTNYYSVIMRTPIHGREIPNSYRKLRLFLSYLSCRITTKRDGELRVIGKMAKKLYMLLFIKN